MLAERTFHVVFVSAGRPVGFDRAQAPDRSVRYGGRRVEVKP
jgi:hypothetical protein